jgi:hypothetical protein
MAHSCGLGGNLLDTTECCRRSLRWDHQDSPFLGKMFRGEDGFNKCVGRELAVLKSI